MRSWRDVALDIAEFFGGLTLGAVALFVFSAAFLVLVWLVMPPSAQTAASHEVFIDPETRCEYLIIPGVGVTARLDWWGFPRCPGASSDRRPRQ